MEPQSSLPHSQAPAIYPYPKPDQSSPRSPSHFLKMHFNNILPFKSSTSKWFLSLKFPYMHLASPPHEPLAPPSWNDVHRPDIKIPDDGDRLSSWNFGLFETPNPVLVWEVLIELCGLQIFKVYILISVLSKEFIHQQMHCLLNLTKF